MHDHLGEPDQGRREPGHLPVRWVAARLAMAAGVTTEVAAGVVAVAAGVVAVVAAAVPGDGAQDLPGKDARGVVLVSGRDDHGLVASQNVLLHSAPEGGSVAGRVPDGTLAQVREVNGNQVRVSASGVTGWVDDFVLRGELRLAGPPPGCRVRVSGQDVAAGTRVEVLTLDGAQARVRLLDPPRTVGTVAVCDLRELAPPPGQACPAAGSGRPGDH